MSKKMWSYEQITFAAETHIRWEMELAAEANGPSRDLRRNIHESRARGALAGWDNLTRGYQDPADAERLINIAKRLSQ